MTVTRIPRAQSYQLLRFDDFLPDPQAEALANAARTLPWQFGWKSNANMAGGHWHVDLDGGTRTDNDAEVAQLLTHELARTLWATAAAGPMQGHTLVRAYANAHTYGIGGNAHMDRRDDGYWSLVYYAVPEWRPQWCGETVFLDHAGDIAWSCLPRPNRAIVFPANVMHAARAVDRDCHQLRVCIVLKTRAPR